MASSCQIVPFPREGRSSSCFALKGVKCKSMHRCAKRSSTRRQGGLLHQKPTASPAGRPYVPARNDKTFPSTCGDHPSSHGFLGRARRLNLWERMVNIKLLASLIMMTLGVAKGLKLDHCQIELKKFFKEMSNTPVELSPASKEDAEVVRAWDGIYVSENKKQTPACVNSGNGTVHYAATQNHYMTTDTQYEVFKIIELELTVIKATDAQGRTWLVFPVKVEVWTPPSQANTKPDNESPRLAFVKLVDGKITNKRGGKYVYCFKKHLRQNQVPSATESTASDVTVTAEGTGSISSGHSGSAPINGLFHEIEDTKLASPDTQPLSQAPSANSSIESEQHKIDVWWSVTQFPNWLLHELPKSLDDSSDAEYAELIKQTLNEFWGFPGDYNFSAEPVTPSTPKRSTQRESTPEPVGYGWICSSETCFREKGGYGVSAADGKQIYTLLPPSLSKEYAGARVHVNKSSALVCAKCKSIPPSIRRVVRIPGREERYRLDTLPRPIWR